MTIKFIYTSLLLFSFVHVGIGQTLPTNTAFYKTKELNVNLEEFQGSKYLNESFEEGTINDALSDKNFQAFVRYDILNDVFEIKETLTQSSPSFLKQAPATSIVINNNTFKYTSYQNEDASRELGYIQVLGNVNNGKLYAKHVAELRLPQKAKTTLEKDRKGKISQRVYYMLMTEDSVRPFDVNKKSIFNLFDSSSTPSIKSFLKETKNKVRNIDDVIAIITYANTL